MNRELVELAQAGNRDAFDTLGAAVVDQLYALARLMLRDTDRAEDAVQEALVRCWRDLPSLRDVSRFEGWLHRILVRAVHDEVRSHRRHQAAVRVLDLEPATADAANAIATREHLERGFEQLSWEHRTVIVFRLYLGLSIEETADRIGIPIGTAKSRLHYASEALRHALEAEARPLAGEVRA